MPFACGTMQSFIFGQIRYIRYVATPGTRMEPGARWPCSDLGSTSLVGSLILISLIRKQALGININDPGLPTGWYNLFLQFMVS
jgi:hypothetical protein